MFISKRAIITPQFEHAKLAAVIASLWGNKQFHKPRLPHDSFVKGVLFHDRGFGEHDHYNLISLSKKERLHTLRQGILKESEDQISNILTILHIKRLIAMYPPSDMKEILSLLNISLSRKLKAVKISQEDFMFADAITEIADDIAFDFALGENSKGSVEIIQDINSRKKTKVHFSIKGSVITMKPWPLSVDNYKGFIIGYERKGYPQQRKPHMISFILKSR